MPQAPRLVGRDADLAALSTAVESDRAITILGEAGIGKTALVREAVSRAGRTRREGGAFGTLRAVPYFALGRAIDAPLAGDPAAVAAQVEQAIGPDVLFIDDLQWADDGTLAVVERLAARLALVVAVRSLAPGSAAALGAMSRAGGMVLALAPLDADAARAVVAGRRPGLSRGVVNDIVRRAAGNPLLLEEMADHGGASDVLTRVLTARLDALAPEARAAVELLAISDAPLPRAALPPGAEDALSASILVQAERGVEVRHQLVADAVRAGLTDDRRRQLHGEVATLLGSGPAAARHLAEAGRDGEAADAALREAARTVDVRDRAALLLVAAETSPGEHALQLRLEAARALDEVAEWAAVRRLLEPVAAWADGESRAEAHALLAHAAYALGDTAAALEHRTRMDEPEIVPGSPASRRRAIEAATLLVNMDGAVAAAIERLDRAAAEVGDADGADDLRVLRSAIVLLASGRGDPDAMRASAELAFEAGRYRTATDRARVVQYLLTMTVGAAAAMAFLLDWHARYEAAGIASMAHEFLADAVVAAFLGGRAAEAVTLADRLLEEPAGQRPTQTAGIYRARALVVLGRIDEAERALDAILATASADFFGQGEALVALAEAALWGGRPERAAERAEAALAVAAPVPVAHAYAALTRAHALAELGRGSEAIGTADSTLSLSTRGAGLEVAALVAGVDGRNHDAADAADRAAAAWAGFDEHRALVSRWSAAEYRRLAGLGRAAEDSLRGVLAEAEAIGFEPLAARIRRSLRLLGIRVTSARRSAIGPGLTPRERELIRLVELGLTNVEIARRLGLGRPTVARILGSAMTKLGVVSRTQLAAAGLPAEA